MPFRPQEFKEGWLLTYALSIYAASPPKVTVVQNVLTRCYKRNYISSHINVYSLLESTIFSRIRK